jgi:cytidyltransferase-like protein
MKKIAVTGYFDPLHKGHLRLFEEAKKLADHLIVILNNDKQAQLKKGKAFMSLDNRKAVLEALDYVDEVFVSVDDDLTVCKSLEAVNPDILARGTYKFEHKLPEKEVCDWLNIQVVYPLGKDIESYTKLEYLTQENIRPWGEYVTVEKTRIFKVKPGKRISLHYHNGHDEFWRIIRGEGVMTIGEESMKVKVGDSFNVMRGVVHRIEAGDEGVEFLELATGNVEKADVVRVSDDFGRD